MTRLTLVVSQVAVAALAVSLNGTQSCPFSGGLSRAPGLPKQARCLDDRRIYVEGGAPPFALSAPSSGDCAYAVAGGSCFAMALGDIQRIELDLSVSKQCQKEGCSRSKGDWVAVWLDPHSGWNKHREIDLMETVFSSAKGSYVKTNFCTTGNPVDWSKTAPFAAHVTMTGKDNADGSRDVYVGHCAHGSSSCKTGPGVTGNAYKKSMERDIVYRLVVDNWGNFCGKSRGTTAGCAVSIDKLEVTLGSSPTPEPTPPRPSPIPSPTPSPSPGSFKPCSAVDVSCCNPHTEIPQFCPNGEKCQDCGGSDACGCPASSVLV